MRHRFFVFCLLSCAFLAPALSGGTARAKVSANFKAGIVIIGPGGDSECTPATEGALRWSSADQTHHMCDGAQWKKLLAQIDGGGAPPNPPPGNGYFVLTAGKWDGDLKTAGGGTDGIDGANKLCLADLTAHDWLGKQDAIDNGQLDAAHVRAFVCAAGHCTSGNLLPHTSYYFAVSGQPARGGAFITANAAGIGPGNTQNWFGTNYFDGVKEYWTHRDTGSNSLWGNTNYLGGACNMGTGSWTSNNPSTQAGAGISNADNLRRWLVSNRNCDSLFHLICIVHP